MWFVILMFILGFLFFKNFWMALGVALAIIIVIYIGVPFLEHEVTHLIHLTEAFIASH